MKSILLWSWNSMFKNFLLPLQSIIGDNINFDGI